MVVLEISCAGSIIAVISL